MPTIDLDMTENMYMFDLLPSTYMFLPFLTNTTDPASQCMLGLDVGHVGEVVFGQRAMSFFPFFIVYGRDINMALT